MICWICYWGWPKACADIYNEAVAKLDGDISLMDYGPAHVVWSDHNFDSAQWCLDHFEEYRRWEYSEEEHEIVRESLRKLLLVPDEIKLYSGPADYDGEYPENFPPATGIELVHR